MLEHAATLHFAERDHVLICEALNRHRQLELTGRFAAAALKRWPQRPVFVYFEALARYGDEPWRMPEHEWLRLERAFDQARAQGDQRTASRLGTLLDAADADDDDFPDYADDDPDDNPGYRPGKSANPPKPANSANSANSASSPKPSKPSKPPTLPGQPPSSYQPDLFDD
jgi:hypothetical protein